MTKKNKNIYSLFDIIISWIGGMCIMGLILFMIMPISGYTEVSTDFLDSVCKDKLGSDNVEFDYYERDNIYCKNIIVVEGVQLDDSESYVILSDGGK